MPRSNKIVGEESRNETNKPAISSSNEGGKKDVECKYLKPRIGHLFQANIEIFKVETPQQVEECFTGITPSRTNLVADNSRSVLTQVKKKRGPGRPFKLVKGRNESQKCMTPSNPTKYLTSFSSVPHPSSKKRVNGRWEKNALIPVRGGLCVHRPSKSNLSINYSNKSQETIETIQSNHCEDQDHFLTFARNIILQTPRNSVVYERRASTRWDEALRTNAFGEIDNRVKHQNGEVRGKKRKLVAVPKNDNIAWGSMKKDDKNEFSSASLKNQKIQGNSKQPIITDKSNVRCKAKKKIINTLAETVLGMEDDEAMLNYLQIKHSGCCHRAQLMAISELSMSRAVKTRKYNQNQKKLDDMTAPLSTVLNPSSESWRRRYQRLGCTATGDIRRRPGIPEYPFFTEHLGNIPSSIFPWGTSVNGVDKVLTIENDHSVEHSSLKEGKLNNEALMNSWRLILECCQKVVKDIENVDRVKRPKLQDLLIIVWKAYSIPKPEGVFGRRDFISKHISQSMNIILDQVEAARDVIAYLSDAIYDEDNEGIDIDSL